MKNNSTVHDIPRRSLRRATIERRVWSESHRDKNTKLDNKSKLPRKIKQTVYQKFTKPSSIKHKNAINFIRKSKLIRTIRSKVQRDTRKTKYCSIKENYTCDDIKHNATSEKSVFAALTKGKSNFSQHNENLKSNRPFNGEESIKASQLIHNDDCNYFSNVNKFLNGKAINDINKYLESLDLSRCRKLEVVNADGIGSQIDNVDTVPEIRNCACDLKSKCFILHPDCKCDHDNANLSSLKMRDIEYKKGFAHIAAKSNLVENEPWCSDDSHVSLSEALAKLVNSDESCQNVESETVTIHPVINVEVRLVNDSPQKGMVEKVNDSLPLISNSLDSKESSLQNDHTFHSKFADEDENGLSHINVGVEKSVLDELEGSCSPDETFTSSADDENSLEEGFIYDKKNSGKLQLPPLIKIPNKTPVLKTPLKCSECPMRFCTVRSLLWHFGTHEPTRNEKISECILLENLIAPWDNALASVNGEQFPTKDFSLALPNFKERKVDQTPYNQNEPKPIFNGEFILKVPIPKLIHRSQMTGNDSSNQDLHSTHCTSEIDNKFMSISSCSLNKVQSMFADDKSHLCSDESKNCFGDINSNKLHLLPTTRPKLDMGDQISTVLSRLTSTFSLSTPASLCRRENEMSKPAVTVIPVESLRQLRQEIEIAEEKNSNSSCDRKKETKLLEKDGLVMINKNLALRIVTSDSEINNSSSISKGLLSNKISSPKCSSLTICPQSMNFELDSKMKDESAPDILTIVPQMNHSKSCSDKISAKLTTASGHVTTDSSQIVKLVLLPSDFEKKKHVDKNKANYSVKNEIHSKHLLSSMFRGFNNLHADFDHESDEESEEGGMVIDVKDEVEESSMDPLSLCTVTMEDDFSNYVSPVVEANDSSVLLEGETNNNATKKTLVDISKRSLVKMDEEKYQRRKYVCQYCQKRFGWSTDLKRHVILHTGERPFKCKWCPITFTRKFLLQNHMKKLHSQVCKWSDLWE